jgi:hypothetical protein
MDGEGIMRCGGGCAVIDARLGSGGGGTEKLGGGTATFGGKY